MVRPHRAGRAVVVTLVALAGWSGVATAAAGAPTGPATRPRSIAPHPAPSPAGSTTAGTNGTAISAIGPGDAEVQPTDAQIIAEQRADELRRVVEARTTAVQSAKARLDTAARLSALALEEFGSAVSRRRLAMIDQLHQDELLADADRRYVAGRAALGRWARQAYLDGGSAAASPTVYTLFAGRPTDDLAATTAMLSRVGESKSLTVAELRRAQRDRTLATSAAAAALVEATAATEAADRARAHADAAVHDLQVRLDAQEDALGTAVDAAQAAQAAARADAALRGAGLGSVGGVGGNAATGQVGDCRGGDLTLYGNGQIPAAALCPVWGAPGELLRADAAYAFNRLSAAYLRRFGTPICVTDSYRSYAEQVDIAARKPLLAATPGHSNHGWGTAADLCGGIETFGSAEHEWMLLQAPVYGWFHPAWAEPTGSTPEPWHWEFGG